MYVAPESKLMMAMANVVSTSPAWKDEGDEDNLPPCTEGF